jgi:alpha-beta hydrolase superfamily lysophospholipase
MYDNDVNLGKVQNMTWITRSVRWLLKKWMILSFFVLLLLLLGAFLSLRQSDLVSWHHEAPKGEFHIPNLGEGEDFSLEQYLDLEERLFAQLDRYAVDPKETPEHSRFIRYATDGPNTPERFSRNWNRTFELIPERIKGGVLLIHGLSDSPYSLRSIGEIFFKNGFYVLGVRLPGHGTVPAALLDVSWKDWYAVVDLAARHVVERTGGSDPFYVCGYSAGGALALKYTVDVLTTKRNRLPDRLFLFSPAVGITGLARVSNSHKSFSWLPAFEKYRWVDIKPEIEPFKYTSFPKNGAAQMWDLSLVAQEGIARLGEQGHLGEFPPVLTFQSVVDATTQVVDVVQKLYGKLPENGSELVAFDLNRKANLQGLFAVDPKEAIAGLQESGNLAYRLTIITNRGNTSDVVAMSTAPFSKSHKDLPTGLQWPAGVYSLSHVALPFPPDDPLYGTGPDPTKGTLRFGNIFAKGEKNVLLLSNGDLIRMRYNPFFDYVEERIEEWIMAGDRPSTGSGQGDR